jgi:hypothetical protein
MVEVRGFARLSTTRIAWGGFAALLMFGALGCGDEPAPTGPDLEPATVEVEVFFANADLGDPCGEVFAVTREVDADDPVTGALEALLAGPTATEQAQGYGGWFSQDTADTLLAATVDDDGTAHVVFSDLRLMIPNASSSCGSAGLLAQLDTTLLAFDHIRSTRYALADQGAFYEWLQLADPDAPEPLEPAAPTEEEEPGEPAKPAPVDLDAGWTLIDDFDWPVQPACCSVQTTGPVSPVADLPLEGWPRDGFYDVEVERIRDELRVTLRRWVACSERPDLPCGDLPDGMTEDTRIVADSANQAISQAPIAAFRVVLVPIQPFDSVQVQAIDGRPGAFASLLTEGLDPAFRTWVYEPLLAGVTVEDVWADLIERSTQPDFPFGLDWCGGSDWCSGPMAYRGPHGVPLLADPLYGGDVGLDRWPPGRNGLYGWSDITLEIRDGAPILYLWAGQIAG